MIETLDQPSFVIMYGKKLYKVLKVKYRVGEVTQKKELNDSYYPR